MRRTRRVHATTDTAVVSTVAIAWDSPSVQLSQYVHLWLLPTRVLLVLVLLLLP
jgi:hypothetical protein